MSVLHVVSHTHWDREWYLPFQKFRFRLIRLVEDLLDILENDPDYRYFVLDGQTIILDDVVAARPDLEAPLRRHIREGRILIGPWFVLPDEFLVSPEALVRNLLWGDRTCREWGAKMDVGYIPDPFGHIGQLPQLLRGVGIDTAIFARGVGDAPVEFLWVAPDGSDVLVSYLRDHYDNVAHLPIEEGAFTKALAAARDSLAPHATSSHLLMMQGTDHLRPRADLPRLLAAAEAALPHRVLHSSFPAYVAAVRQDLGEAGLAALPRREGELRDPSRRHLLPGVLSARMWIKQRNHACETLLERWAEPFSALAHLQTSLPAENTTAFLRLAWRYLLENHPHDSICGCSVDQVHREMVTRFDWCEQVGETLTDTALDALAAQVDTGEGPLPALVVFNPSDSSRTDRVVAAVAPPVEPEGAELVGPDGRPVPFRVVRNTFLSEMTMTFDPATVRQMIAEVEETGSVWGEWAVRSLQVWRAGGPRAGVVNLAVAVTRDGGPGPLPQGQVEHLRALLADASVREIRARIREDEVQEIAFVARDVPPHGYAVYRFRPQSLDETPRIALLPDVDPTVIENAFFRVSADVRTGRLTVVDKETGLALRDCHRIVDRGDRGDEYNFCPPETDLLVDAPGERPFVGSEVDAVGQHLFINQVYRVPEALVADRAARSEALVDLPIQMRVSLRPGVRRIDFETTVENAARDHRLRVHFPVPFSVEKGAVAGHWDVVERPLSLPVDTDGWVEAPVPAQPQRGWASVTDGEQGVTLANRGLPEVEILPGDGAGGIVLTLLRCVGWLSREDFPCRVGRAGPTVATPEAQCPGRHTFRYSLIPHAGDWRAAVPAATAFQVDLRAVAVPPASGPLPDRLSFVRVEPAALRVSALKLPEGEQGAVLRLWNVQDSPVEGTVRLWRPFARAIRTDMAERAAGPALAEDTDTVALTVRGREVVTLCFTF